MRKTALKITVTVHSNGAFSVLIEWISSDLSTDLELAAPLCWGYCRANEIKPASRFHAVLGDIRNS